MMVYENSLRILFSKIFTLSSCKNTIVVRAFPSVMFRNLMVQIQVLFRFQIFLSIFNKIIYVDNLFRVK